MEVNIDKFVKCENVDEIDIKEFIKHATAKVQEVLKKFNWTEESLLKPLESSSQFTEEESEDDELPFPETLSVENSVTLDQNVLSTLLNKPDVEVPQRFSDLQCKFDREQKLLIYEYVVQHAQSKEHKETSLLMEQEKEFAEIVAAMKQEKKKRRKHRTMKPTYMEELRAVVDMQMQALERCQQQNKCQIRNYSRTSSPITSKRKRHQ